MSAIYATIRAACVKLLATVALSAAAIAAQVSATASDVTAALSADWQTFRRVAGDGCWHWTLEGNAIAVASRRELVGRFVGASYAAPTKERRADELSATWAIGRGLTLLGGSGTVEAIAVAAGCTPATIQQQAARYERFLTVEKQLTPSESGRRRIWRIVHVAIRSPK